MGRALLRQQHGVPLSCRGARRVGAITPRKSLVRCSPLPLGEGQGEGAGQEQALGLPSPQSSPRGRGGTSFCLWRVLCLPNLLAPLQQASYVRLLSIQAICFRPRVEHLPWDGDFHSFAIEGFFDATPQFQLRRPLL